MSTFPSIKSVPFDWNHHFRAEVWSKSVSIAKFERLSKVEVWPENIASRTPQIEKIEISDAHVEGYKISLLDESLTQLPPELFSKQKRPDMFPRNHKKFHLLNHVLHLPSVQNVLPLNQLLRYIVVINLGEARENLTEVRFSLAHYASFLKRRGEVSSDSAHQR